MTCNDMVKLILHFLLAISSIVYYLNAATLPALATGDNVNATWPNCSIRGYVTDSYGTGVPGAEVRLVAADGSLCRIPDNPVMSGTSESGGAGYFEYRGVQSGSYAITGAKDGYTGSVTIVAGEGDVYVELTLPEYVYRRSVDTKCVSSVSPIDVLGNRSELSVAVECTAANRTEKVLPDVWHIALGGCVMIAGALTAVAILKKR